MTFTGQRQRVLRKAREKANYARFKEQQTAYEYSRKAAHIIRALSKLSYNAKDLNTGDIVQKVNSGQELDFYYRWCCYVL